MSNVLKLLILSFLLASCTGNSESVSIPNDFNPGHIISNQNHLQKILTKEMVAKAVNVPVKKIEEHTENNIAKPGQYTLLYSWPTGKSKMVGNKYSIAEYHSMSIGFVAQMNEAGFIKRHGTNDGLQQQVNQMAAQENLNKEIATAEALYIADYAQRRKIEQLENIGTPAFWETPMHALHVWVKDAAFTITANFGDDETLAKKKSIELVKAILNH